MARFVLALGLLLALGACAQPPLPQPLPERDLDIVLSSCCAGVERYPDWVIEITERAPAFVMPYFGTVDFRQGYLADRSDAHDMITAVLQPMDLLLFRSKGKLSGQLIPGHFGHGAIYLGTEDQLRALGLWDAAWLRPYRERIRGGDRFIDAVSEGVRVTDRETLFDTDAVGIFRPRFSSASRRAEVIREMVTRIGTPFDFDFDSSESETLFCLELINMVLPELGLPHRPAYGRTTILPDDLAAIALRGTGPISFVGYLEGNPRGWRTQTAAGLAHRIGAAWDNERGIDRSAGPA